MNIADITYETSAGYVARVSKGWYVVYINTGVVAERKATYHFSSKPDYALARAMMRLDELTKELVK